jgi:hypothetical protein
MAWLAAARMVVRLVPFRLLSRRLTRSSPHSPSAETLGRAELRRIGWALNAVGNKVPWRCQCLERAIAGKLLLRLRGQPSTIFLGVSRPEPGHGLQAHAWLRCGGVPVVGEEGPARAWSVVASLSDEAGPGRDGSGPPGEAIGAIPPPVVFPARHR